MFSSNVRSPNRSSFYSKSWSFKSHCYIHPKNTEFWNVLRVRNFNMLLYPESKVAESVKRRTTNYQMLQELFSENSWLHHFSESLHKLWVPHSECRTLLSSSWLFENQFVGVPCGFEHILANGQPICLQDCTSHPAQVSCWRSVGSGRGCS